MRRPLRASRFMVGNNSEHGSWRLIPQARTQNRVHMAHPSNYAEPRYRSRGTRRSGKLRGQTEISGPGPGRAAAHASIRNANGAPDSASGRRPANAECFSRDSRALPARAEHANSRNPASRFPERVSFRRTRKHIPIRVYERPYSRARLPGPQNLGAHGPRPTRLKTNNPTKLFHREVLAAPSRRTPQGPARGSARQARGARIFSFGADERESAKTDRKIRRD